MKLTHTISLALSLLLLCAALATLSKLMGDILTSGGEIAFTVYYDLDNGDIYSIDINHGLITPLVNTEHHEGNPQWTPDGEHLLFLSDAYIWSVDDRGNNLLNIDITGTGKTGFSWSPDGIRILYEDVDAAGEYQLYIRNADGSNYHKITFDGAWHPNWSPDSSQIVFENREDNQILVMTPDGENRRILAEGSDPVWSPDGTQIAFIYADGGQTDIYVINPDGSNRQRLTYTTAAESSPSWSPDGTQIAFVQVSSGRVISIMDADGSNIRCVVCDRGQYYELSWRP